MFKWLCSFLLFYTTCFLLTSHSVDIDCIPLRFCPLAMKLIKTKKYAPETISFLKTSHCGYEKENKEAMVWCSKFIQCTTPLNEDGTCQDVKLCPHVLEIMQQSDISIPTVKEFIQRYRCNNNYEDDIQVCCPYENNKITDRYGENWEKDDEEDMTYHHDPYFHNYYWKDHDQKPFDTDPYPHEHDHKHRIQSGLWENQPFKKHFMKTFNSTRKNQIPDTIENREVHNLLKCETPDRKKGSCKPVKECKSFRDLIQSGYLDLGKETTKQFLRNFRCSRNDNEIKVCCSENDITESNEKVFNSIRYKNPTNCGKAVTDNKIFGGKTTDLGEYPWLALMQYKRGSKVKYGCGGTLIDDRHILTAGHCVDREILNQKRLGTLYRVILGEHDIRNRTDCFYTKYGAHCADPPQHFGVESIDIHPLFNSTTAINDIAIVTLERKVFYSDYIKPICLPTSPGFSLKGNESFNIAGWGKTETEPMSPVKLKAKVDYTKKSDCNTRYFPLSGGQICAGIGNGTDSCYGDSGGPLMLEVNDDSSYSTSLLGIISYGIEDCGNGPGVFTYIPFYMEWISKTLAYFK